MFYHLFYIISIHALRVEGDGQVSVTATVQKYFYPRPPGGGRPLFAISIPHRLYFYPRPPGGGRPLSKLALAARHTISIHALRVEGDCTVMFRTLWSS